MAFPREDLLVMSDAEDDDFRDSTFSIRPVQPLSSNQSGSQFNVQAIPIGGGNIAHLRTSPSKQKPSNKVKDMSNLPQPPITQTVTTDMFDDDEDSSEEVPLFVKNESAKSTVNLSDYEQNDADSVKAGSVRSAKTGSPYRRTAYHFGSDEVPPEYQHNELVQIKKRNVILNVFLLGVVSLFQGIGFIFYFPDILLLNIGSVSLQHASTFALLGTCAFSALVSLVVINITGEKWAIFIGGVGTTFFTCSRLFLSPSFVMTASLLSGFSQGLYSVAVLVYLHQLGAEYSSLSGQDLHNVMCYFTAYLHAWNLAAPFISSLLRYIFLMDESNRSFHDVHTDTDCGADFCWDQAMGLSLFEADNVHKRSSSDMFRLQGLLGSFLVCSLGAAFLAWSSTAEEPEINQLYHNLTLARRQEVGESCSDAHTAFTLHLLLKPFQCFCDKNISYLLPLFLFLGCQQMLAYSIYMQTFTQCASGVTDSLLVAAIMSAGAAVLSMPVGALIGCIGKFKVILPAMAIQLAIFLTLFVKGELVLKFYFVIASFWGLSDGILQNCVIVMCTSVDPQRCPGMIACARACQALGYIVIAVFQLYLCNGTILIFSMCLLILSAVMYVSMEIKVRLDARAAMEFTGQYVPLQTEASWIPRVNPVHVSSDKTEPLASRLPYINPDVYDR